MSLAWLGWERFLTLDVRPGGSTTPVSSRKRMFGGFPITMGSLSTNQSSLLIGLCLNIVGFVLILRYLDWELQLDAVVFTSNATARSSPHRWVFYSYWTCSTDNTRLHCPQDVEPAANWPSFLSGPPSLVILLFPTSQSTSFVPLFYLARINFPGF